MAVSPLKLALDEAQKRGGVLHPNPAHMIPEGMAIDNTRPVNSMKFTPGGPPAEAPGWSTSAGATPEPARAPGTSLVPSGPGLAERQPTRVPFGASAGVTPPSTPNLPATIPGQGSTFQGNGATQNFTQAAASSPYNAQDARFDPKRGFAEAAREAAQNRSAVPGSGANNWTTSPGAATGADAVRGGATGPAKAFNPNPSVFERAGETLGRMAASPTGQAIGQIASNKWVQGGLRLAGAAGGAQLAMTPSNLADGTLTQAHVDALKRPWDPNAKPIDVTTPGGGLTPPSDRPTQNPLRVQEFNAGLFREQSGPIPERPADYSNEGRNYPTGAPVKEFYPEQKARETPGTFGDYSPLGTFGNGYTDMGGGIAGKSNRPDGKVNDYTNIGANGKPTALSQVDSRTPDQIANGEKIKAQTAATVAAAGGLGNLQRQNALMAANLRDGVDPYRGFNGPSVSIMQNTSGSGGGQSGKGGAGHIADMVKELKSAGIKVSHSTLRQIMQSDTQLRTNEATNATQRATNAATNQTSLATNANSNQTSLATNAATNAAGERNNLRSTAASIYSADGPVRTKEMELRAQQAQRDRIAGYMKAGGGSGGSGYAAGIKAAGAAGDTAAVEMLTKMANDDRERAMKGAEHTQELVAPASITTDKDDQPIVTKALQVQNAALVRNMTGGQFEELGGAEKEANAQQLLPAMNTLRAANERRSNNFWQQLPSWMPGAETASPELGKVPDFKGAGPMDTVGGWEGAFTGGDVKKGDKKVKMANGSTMYMNNERLGQAELEFLKSRGVTLRGAQ